MLFQHFAWDLTHQVLFLYIYFAQPLYELERPDLENAHTLVQRTNIFSWKFSVKVSWMLDNPFLVPSLCKLNPISLCFIQISAKPPAKLLIPSGKALFLLKFGPLGKFRHDIKISIKTANVSRLSVSCDYGLTLWLTNKYIIRNTAILKRLVIWSTSWKRFWFLNKTFLL